MIPPVVDARSFSYHQPPWIRQTARTSRTIRLRSSNWSTRRSCNSIAPAVTAPNRQRLNSPTLATRISMLLMKLQSRRSTSTHRAIPGSWLKSAPIRQFPANPITAGTMTARPPNPKCCRRLPALPMASVRRLWIRHSLPAVRSAWLTARLPPAVTVTKMRRLRFGNSRRVAAWSLSIPAVSTRPST